MCDSSTEVRNFPSDASLPPVLDAVFSDPRAVFLESREWLRNFERSGIGPGSRLRLYALMSAADKSRSVLLPAVYSRLYAVHPRAKVLHFPGVEGMPYAPWPARAPLDDPAAIGRVIDSIHAKRRGYDVLRFSPLEPFTPVIEQIVEALRRTGHPTRIYEMPRASFASTAGITSDEYLAARPQALRAPLDRARRTLEDAGRARFRLVFDEADAESALRDYKRVEGLSDLTATTETPRYLPGLLPVAARCGALRLGFFDIDGVPAAAQLWIISAGVAHCLRIVSVPGPDGMLLEDLLTANMARHLIDVDRVAELDFGMVTDEFARNWASGMRQRVGVIAFNPRTWRGVKGTVRHITLPRLLSIPRRLRRKFGRRRT